MQTPRTFTLIGAAIAAVLLAVSLKTASAEKQPQMKEALQKLEQAKNHLEKATADKGGHRVKAIGLIDQALAEVKLGIEADNAK